MTDETRQAIGERGPLHACAITDDAYAPFTAAMFASLFAHHRPAEVSAHIISSGLSRSNLRKLEETGAKFGARVDFHIVDKTLVSRFSGEWTHSYISVESYYKFFIGQILTDVQRVLYLDVDTIVLDGLHDLFDTDLGENVVGVVQTYDESRWGLSLNRRYGLPAGHHYFNSGVMLLDLERWRSRDIGGELIACAAERRVHDEVAFNIVLSSRYRLLHPRFNVGPHLTWFGDRLYIADHYGFPPEAYAEASRSPAIVHFCGKSKPWNVTLIHPEKREYYRYASLTPYAGTAPTDRNARNILLKPAYWANTMLWRLRVIRESRAAPT